MLFSAEYNMRNESSQQGLAQRHQTEMMREEERRQTVYVLQLLVLAVSLSLLFLFYRAKTKEVGKVVLRSFLPFDVANSCDTAAGGGKTNRLHVPVDLQLLDSYSLSLPPQPAHRPPCTAAVYCNIIPRARSPAGLVLRAPRCNVS